MQNEEEKSSSQQLNTLLPGFILGVPSFLASIEPSISIHMAAISLLAPALFTGASKTEKLLNLLQEEFDEMNERGIVTEDYLKSESYSELVLDIIGRAAKINSESKLNAARNIFKSAISNSVAYEASNEKYCVSILNEITSDQIRILNFFNVGTTANNCDTWHKLHTAYAAHQTGENILEFELSQISDKNRADNVIEKYAFKNLVNRLEYVGVISLGNGLQDYEGNDGALVTGEYIPPAPKITPLGHIFIAFLKDPS